MCLNQLFSNIESAFINPLLLSPFNTPHLVIKPIHILKALVMLVSIGKLIS